MSDLKLSLLLVGLIALISAVMYRFMGAPAFSFLIIGAINIGQSYRRKRREEHQKALSELRIEDPAEHERLLQSVPDRYLRSSLLRALEEEGTVGRSGNVENYPYPRSFVRFVRRRYWGLWTLAAIALSVAAFAPALMPLWRLVLLGIGSACMIGVWRTGRSERYLQASIEIAPSHIAYVASDGSRYSLPFYPKLTVEAESPESDLMIRAPGNPNGILLSRYLVGFNRLKALVYRYSGAIPVVPQPANEEL